MQLSVLIFLLATTIDDVIGAAEIGGPGRADFIKRDGVAILNDYKVLDATMKGWKTDLDAYNGQGSQTLVVDHDFDKIVQGVDQATRDANNTAAGSVDPNSADALISGCTSLASQFPAPCSRYRQIKTSRSEVTDFQSRIATLKASVRAFTSKLATKVPPVRKASASACGDKFYTCGTSTTIGIGPFATG